MREKGLIEFINPQSPTEMLTGKATQISTQYHQVKAGGDIAAILGLCKHVFAADDAAKADGKRVLDVEFIERHTQRLRRRSRRWSGPSTGARSSRNPG